MNLTTDASPEDSESAAQRRAAYSYVSEAFAEGRMDGIESDCMAQAALFAALTEFVETYGEEPVAAFAERLPDRIRRGEFTIDRSRQ